MQAEVGGNMRISQGHGVYTVVPDTALCGTRSSAVYEKMLHLHCLTISTYHFTKHKEISYLITCSRCRCGLNKMNVRHGRRHVGFLT